MFVPDSLYGFFYGTFWDLGVKKAPDPDTQHMFYIIVRKLTSCLETGWPFWSRVTNISTRIST
jgi:hypothetical protein